MNVDERPGVGVRRHPKDGVRSAVVLCWVDNAVREPVFVALDAGRGVST